MRIREIKYILQNVRHARRDRRRGNDKVIDACMHIVHKL